MVLDVVKRRPGVREVHGSRERIETIARIVAIRGDIHRNGFFDQVAQSNAGGADLDEVAAAYYEEAGQPLDDLIRHIAHVGLVAAHRWWQPARAHAAVRVIGDHPNTVIAFGAGHSHFEDDVAAEPVHHALADCFVVLLLPAADPEVAHRVLADRCTQERGEGWGGSTFRLDWVRSAQNWALADNVVYTGSRTAGEVADEVVGHVRHDAHR